MAERAKRPLPEDIIDALPKVQRICRDLPDCEETLSFGNPSFKRGRNAFVVLDRYKGQSCVWVLVDPAIRDDRLAADGWFASPYDRHETALCCRLDKVDWVALEGLIGASYELCLR